MLVSYKGLLLGTIFKVVVTKATFKSLVLRLRSRSLCSVALLSATTLNYALSLVSLVMFYVYYTHTDGCTENKAFISVNMLLCVGASVMSILPKIQVTDSR